MDRDHDAVPFFLPFSNRPAVRLLLTVLHTDASLEVRYAPEGDEDVTVVPIHGFDA